LRRCLQKDPNLRLHDIADVRIEIVEAIAPPSETGARSQPANLRWFVASLSIMVAASLLTYFITRLYSPGPAEPVTRLAVALAPGEQLAGTGDSGIAISPDGLHLAYVATRAGSAQIYLRAIDSLERVPVSGSEGGTSPFFSPDGRSLGFF